jgi:hypothetical protein
MSVHWLHIAVATLTVAVVPFTVAGGNEAVEPSWGLSPRVSDELAAEADSYLGHRADFISVARVDSTRYWVEEQDRADGYELFLPGLPYGDESHPEFQFRTDHSRRRSKSVPRRLRAFPSPHDWAMLFGASNQPFFMFREVGTRLEAFDLVREIRFRGALPFTNGRDIREWEGVALVDAVLGRIVEIRARPNNQAARLRWLFARWSRSCRITLGISVGPIFIPGLTIRFARRPLAYRCFVRFDDRKDEIWLPTLMSYEIREAVSKERTVLRRLSTRHYMHERSAP